MNQHQRKADDIQLKAASNKISLHKINKDGL